MIPPEPETGDGELDAAALNERQVDDLAERLYPKVSARIRNELRFERERSGHLLEASW